MDWMTCTTCRAIAQSNNVGICYACQMGFQNEPSEDHHSVIKAKEKPLEDLLDRKKEIEDALQKPEAKSVPARKQAGDGKKVGRRAKKTLGAPKKKKE